MTTTTALETVGFWWEAGRHPDKPAVITADGAVTTYGELAARVNRLSNVLLERGLGPGSHLGFLLGNRVTTFEVALACVRAGVLYTPLNRSFTGEEIAYVLADCGAAAFIAEEEYAPAAVAAAALAPPELRLLLSVGAVPGFEPIDEAAASVRDTPSQAGPAGAPFYYTSGTTGRPKGVVRGGRGAAPLAEALAGFVEVARANGCPPDGTYLAQGPLHHSGPLGGSLNVLHAGATVVLMGKWDAELCLQLIERHRVCATLMVPTMFYRLLALPPEVRARYDVSSLREGLVKHGSAQCPVAVKRAMIEWFGPVLRETYGGQEGVIATVTSADWLAHPGTVGRPRIPVRILDDDGVEVPVGTPGTIYADLGDVGYHHAPGKTAASRQGTLFTLGDLGYLDADGWLYLVDRRVDLIISGGVNIYPAEIEAALVEHPDVADVAVIGVPDPEWGHQVKALVVLTSSARPGPDTAADLIEFCRERIARFKAPRSVDFLDVLPRDHLGKLQRARLREAYVPSPDQG